MRRHVRGGAPPPPRAGPANKVALDPLPPPVSVGGGGAGRGAVHVAAVCGSGGAACGARYVSARIAVAGAGKGGAEAARGALPGAG